MADPLCKFFDAPSITGSQFFATYFSTQKPFILLPLVSLHNPTIVKRRRKRKPLHIAFCSTSTSPNLDVISTHEHSDGSLLFRFGDPSEVAKEDELEVSQLRVDELQRDSEEEFSVVTVFDGDNEREVIVKKVEARGQAVTVATDPEVSDSIVTNNERSDFVELEAGLSGKNLEDSTDGIGSILLTEIQDSVAEVNIENDGHVEEILEKKDDGEASISPTENSFPSMEVEEEINHQLSEESFEELDDDILPTLGSAAAMPEYSDSVSTQEVEEAEGEGSSQSMENGGDKDQPDDSIHLMENGAASTEVQAVDNDTTILAASTEVQEVDNDGEITLADSTEVQEMDNDSEIALAASAEVRAVDNDSEISLADSAEFQAVDNDRIVLAASTEVLVVDNNNEVALAASAEVQAVDDDRIILAASTEDPAVYNDSEITVAASAEVQAVDNDSETTQLTERISENNDPAQEESTESVNEENNLGNTENVVDQISPENVDVRNLSMDAEDRSTQVLSIDSDDQIELISLPDDTVDQPSQNGILKDSGETNETEVMPLSPKLDAEPIPDEEIDDNIMVESNEGESPLPPDENLLILSLEAERKEEVEYSEIIEVSDHELVEDKSSDVLDSSKEPTPAEYILSSGATLLQHPSKALTGGHEAYFVAGGKWLGVADGVGRWSLEGSDPGVYAHELMQNSESVVSQCCKDIINDPKQVLSQSVSKTDSPGSSTALIAHFDGKVLHVANIGDSGFVIVRNGRVYRKSSPMLHEFNLPIQIEKGDDPSQLLEEYNIELDEGDIIVTATDALFDNLYDQEIVSIVSRSLEADKSPQEIAEILATRVLEAGGATSGRSPFADAAQAAGYVGYTGGKRDDVVVIVSVVQKESMSNAD